MCQLDTLLERELLSPPCFICWRASRRGNSGPQPDGRCRSPGTSDRGSGSIYYLMHAIHHGLPTLIEELILPVSLTAVAVSIILHGIYVRTRMRHTSNLAH